MERGERSPRFAFSKSQKSRQASYENVLFDFGSKIKTICLTKVLNVPVTYPIDFIRFCAVVSLYTSDRQLL